jgi:hypothetical protein
MTGLERHLHVVRPGPARGEAAPPRELPDVGVTVMLFLVTALPVASALAGVGRWDDASLGVGTLGVLLTGRELGALALARWRSGRRA